MNCLNKWDLLLREGEGKEYMEGKRRKGEEKEWMERNKGEGNGRVYL